ncbi:hypothetical protein Syn7502_03664 (plasmid) [Synechococcus sp. PCC 7502]|nr:hypothetical protein Syn7502_03664 [Synechococcus sp. PCC 7502]
MYSDTKVHVIEAIRLTSTGYQYTGTSMSKMSYAIDRIQDMYLPSDGANLAQKQLAIALNNRYIMSCYWIGYERLGIGNLNKAPLNNPSVRRERPFATLLMSYLELCKGCHEFARSLYPHDPIIHWLDVVLEFKESFIEYSIKSRQDPDLGLYQWLALQRQLYKRLENRKNPFSESCPFFFNLIATSCRLAEKNKIFDVKFWVPFLRAFREYYKHVQEKGVGVMYISGDRLLQTARGKPRSLRQPKTTRDVKDEKLAEYYCLRQLESKSGKRFKV